MNSNSLVAIVLLTVVGAAEGASPTLEEFERAAVARNGAIRASGLEASSLRWAAEAAARGGRPDLRLRSGLRETVVAEPLVPVINPGSLPTADDSFGEVRLEVAAPISTGGRVAAAERQARAQGEGGRLRAARTVQETVFEVRRLVARSLAARQVVAALDASAEALRRHAEATERRQAEGRATRTELLRLRSRLATVEEERGAAENERRVGLARLEALSGLAAEDVSGDLGAMVGDGTPVSPVEGLVERALAGRPDLAALTAAAWGARAEGELARAEGRPRVDLVAGLGLRTALGEDETETVGSVAVEVVLPVFDGGRRAARRQAAGRREAAWVARREDAVAWLRAEVASALLSLESARGRVRAAGAAAAAAAGALEAAEAAREAGRASVAELLDAEAEVREARRRRAVAEADAVEARARLSLAVGEEVAP